jgi:mannosyltransferase
MTFGVLLLIFLLGFGLRLYGLDSSSLWLDEIFTATTARLDLASILQFHLEEAANPPLISVITHLFFACWGQSEFVARLPSALFGSLSILLIYEVGKELWSRKVALTGAFLLAVNAYHVHYSQEARHYALMVFLALLSVIFLLKALQRNKPLLWAGFAVSTTLGLYNHYFAFLTLPALVALGTWDLLEKWKLHLKGERSSQDASAHQIYASVKSQAMLFAASLVLIALLYLPWASTLLAQFPKRLSPQPIGLSTISLKLSLHRLSETLASYSDLGVAASLLWALAILVGLATSGKKRSAVAVLWIGSPFIFLAVVQVKHFFSIRYTIFILPLCLLLMGRGLTALAAWLERPLGRLTRHPHSAPVLLSSFAILWGLLSVAPLADHYTHEKEDWRDAARYLAANMAPGDAILADSTAYEAGSDADRVVLSLPYYLEVNSVTGNSVFSVQHSLWRRLTAWDQWNGRLWAVLWNPQLHVDEASIAQEVEFNRISVLRLEDPSGGALLDTERLLRLLLGLIPEGDARFDVHLALANIYMRTGRPEQANSELQLARELEPDHPTASDYLEKELARFRRLSQSLDGMDHPLWCNFGQEIALLGYAFAPPDIAQPGDALEVSVWWYPLRAMDRDYTAFVHILDADGVLRAQQDNLLQRGRRTTSQWKPGEVVTVKYQMVLPAEAPSGLYTINLGVYYWETAERLSAQDESGERLSGDVVQVQQIQIASQDD